MRVLHYRRSFSELSETFIYDSILELERQGVENYVLTHRHVNESDRPFDKVVTVEEPVRWNPSRLLRGVMTSEKKRKMGVHLWPQIRKEIENELRKIKPDVIHAHFGPEGVIVETVADKLVIPLVTSFYGYDMSRLIRQNFWVEQYQRVFNTSKSLIGISNHVCNKLRQIGASQDKIQRLHLGIRISGFPYNRSSEQDNGVINCLHVGRLTEKKSPINLVRAFKHACKIAGEEINLHLKIAGDGELKEDLVEEIQRLKIGNRIEVLGNVKHSEIPKLMRDADIYTQHCITASDGDQEGLGVSFIEASASGLPIVATNHNGLPDVILDKKTGFLVKEGDYIAMGEQIIRLAENPELRVRFGQNGRKHVEEKFDIEKQAVKLLHSYDKTVVG